MNKEIEAFGIGLSVKCKFQEIKVLLFPLYIESNYVKLCPNEKK